MSEIELKDILRQLEKANSCVTCTRSAMMIWHECMDNVKLERAARMREEARNQAMDGAKALIETARIIEKYLGPLEFEIERPDIIGIIEKAEAGQS